MNEGMKSIRVLSSVNQRMTRRQLFRGVACAIAGVAVSKLPDSAAAPALSAELADETLAFIHRCARADGGYHTSPGPAHPRKPGTKRNGMGGGDGPRSLARSSGAQPT